MGLGNRGLALRWDAGKAEGPNARLLDAHELVGLGGCSLSEQPPLFCRACACLVVGAGMCVGGGLWYDVLYDMLYYDGASAKTAGRPTRTRELCLRVCGCRWGEGKIRPRERKRVVGRKGVFVSFPKKNKNKTLPLVRNKKVSLRNTGRLWCGEEVRVRFRVVCSWKRQQ